MSKFYPLEHDEWLKACNELTPSEKDVLYYIRTLDPYSKGVKVNASEIALKINVNRSTVSRALKTLDVKGFIDLEILLANVVIKSQGVLHQRNSVAPTQQNDVASAQQCCVAIAPVAPTQHDPIKTGSGQGSVFSKISLDRSIRSDRSSDFDFSENSEQFPKHLEAIASCRDEVLENDDLNPVDEVEDTKSPKKAANPVEGDSPRRKLEDFILKSLQSAPKNRQAYFAKFTAADWEKWETKFKPPVSPPVSQRDPVAEDPWRVENAIASMVKCRDFEAAEIRLANIEKTNPVLAAQLREKYLCS